MRPTPRLLATTATALALLGRARTSSAQVLERFALRAEGGVGAIVNDPYAQRFGLGGHVIGRLGFQIIGPLEVQASVGNWWFTASDGPPGRLLTVGGGLRFAPRVGRVVGGPVFDVNASWGLTGDLQRFVLDAGVGWEFTPVSAFGVGPMLRYARVFQPKDQAVPDDSQVVMAGVALTLRVPRSEPRDAAAARPADGDRDGVLDEQDRCPTQPEDHDGFRDDDGCPDPDNDDDGIPDAQDRCPSRAEVRNGFEDDDGCPDEAPPPPPAPTPVAAAPSGDGSAPASLQVSEQVQFAFGSARLRSRYTPTLDRVCATLQAHPEITTVRVSGHADERGTPEGNAELSAYRAAAVARYLAHCGVAPERVESSGFGATRPLCTDDSEECRARNRRVDFQTFSGRHSAATPATPSQ